MLLPSQAPEPRDPEEVRRLADEILSRPEFQPAPETLLERLARWFADLFGDGGSQGEAPPPGSGGSSVLTVLLLVVLVVALVFVVRALLRQPRRRRSEAAPVGDVDVVEHRSVAEWERSALDHEAAGRWKEGLRCRFRALVGALVDRQVLPASPGRTSGELRADIREVAPGAAADFAAAATLFDAAWYGDLPTGPDEASRFGEHAERVLATATPAPEPETETPVPVLVGSGEDAP